MATAMGGPFYLQIVVLLWLYRGIAGSLILVATAGGGVEGEGGLGCAGLRVPCPPLGLGWGVSLLPAPAAFQADGEEAPTAGGLANHCGGD